MGNSGLTSHAPIRWWKQAKSKRDHVVDTENFAQLRELMGAIDARQQRLKAEINREKDYNHALKVWELQKYVDAMVVVSLR